jgi:predicted GH43/DUF377 family glycosyl hydrolase
MNYNKINTLFTFIFFCCLILLINFSYKNYRSIRYISKKINRNVIVLNKSETKWPEELTKVPFADKCNIVLKTKKISIENIQHPYNSSIIKLKNEKNYELFFRFDVKNPKPLINKKLKFSSFIGKVSLDENFCVIGKTSIINTKSNYSEDPRVFKINNKVYLTYNDLAKTKKYCRTIRLAELKSNNIDVNFITDLDLHLNSIEKNWMPFEFFATKASNKLYFVYQMNPHKILNIENPKCNKIENILYPDNPTLISKIWPEKWGVPRGGTPAQLVNGEYLSFFHSSFKSNLSNKTWYVMGAYTFEAKPPFRITKISRHPILFKNIYDIKHRNMTSKNLRCIFPAGYVVDKLDGKQVLHVSCGINDSGTKIITIDKDNLIKSMKKIEYSKHLSKNLIATE